MTYLFTCDINIGRKNPRLIEGFLLRPTYKLMKKRLQKFGEEILPLSSHQSLVLLVLVACVFQLVLFFTPALAAEAMVSDDEQVISLGTVTKSLVMDKDAQIIADEIKQIVVEEPVATTTPEIVKDKVISTSLHVMTAYNSEVGQTDDSPCITANGFNVCKHGIEDTVAANFLKFGTKVKIPDLYGDRIFIVRDRMNKKHPNRVDIWMKDRADAIQFGIKTTRIQVIE